MARRLPRWIIWKIRFHPDEELKEVGMKVKMILQLRVQLFLSLWQIVGSKKKIGNSLPPQKHKFIILKQEVFHI